MQAVARSHDDTRESGPSAQLLRLRRLLLVLGAAVLKHLLELLLLRVRQQRLDLIAAILLDAAEFRAAVLWRKAGVRAHAGYLLLAVGDNRLDLRDLVFAEPELLAEVVRGALRVRRVPALLLHCRCAFGG